MDQFVKNVNKILNSLVSSGDKILVGVSGGADSLALLYSLRAFSKTKKISLAVAHINHMARGFDSNSDAEFVTQISEKMELPFFLKEIDVNRECLKLKRSFQETARIIRYQFFNKILSEKSYTKIALGHTADDQVETILLNFIRGSGLKGLTGIPQTRGNIIRPFLKIYRNEIESYLNANNFSFRNDLSNNDSKYFRNKIRNELVPYLEIYNPSIKKNLNEMSGILEQDEFLLSQRTREIFKQNFYFKKKDEKKIVWNIYKFRSYSVGLQRRLIRETFYEIIGELQGITAFHVDLVVKLFHAPLTGKIINLPKNVIVQCSYDVIEFRQVLNRFKKNNIEREILTVPILIPGVTEIKNVNIMVQTQIVEKNTNFSSLNTKLEAFFDIDKTGSNLKARFFRAGDRFCPLGMSGSKKLKSFFIDKKVPQNLRHRIPILTNEKDDIIWVYGQRIAHFCRVTDKTKKMLYVQGNKAIN